MHQITKTLLYMKLGFVVSVDNENEIVEKSHGQVVLALTTLTGARRKRSTYA
jgi:hypothetical protein